VGSEWTNGQLGKGKFTPSFYFMKLIKFEGKKIPEFLNKFKGRKVCDVSHKIGLKPAVLGDPVPFVIWRGSTETEYFIVTFYGGMVMMDIQEREMLLGHEEFYIIALAPTLGELNDMSMTLDQFDKKVSLNVEYLLKKYQTDIEDIRFTDVMKILGWKYVSRKVKEENFCFDS
jgi:hypothetical protein